MNIEVKYGLITLVKQTLDLCEQLEKIDMKCPLEKGDMLLTKEVDLPSFIPKVRIKLETMIGNHENLHSCRAPTLSWQMFTPMMMNKSPA